VIARARELLAADGIDIDGARILLIGITHAAGQPDAENSPAVEIMQVLLDAGAAVAYHDPLVPRITLPRRRTFTSATTPSDLGADLVVVHTIHPGVDLSWLDASYLVLDTTYRLSGPYRHPVL
jgi:UDP-N-acetyl-D-mannosaminuronate dehydrogenase